MPLLLFLILDKTIIFLVIFYNCVIMISLFLLVSRMVVTWVTETPELHTDLKMVAEAYYVLHAFSGVEKLSALGGG